MVKEVKKEMRRYCKAIVFTCSILMAGFWGDGMVDETAKVWIEMGGRKNQARCDGGQQYDQRLLQGEEMERAEELFTEMELSEIEPSGATIEHSIRGYCRVGDINLALLLCRDVKGRWFGLENVVVDELFEGMCEKKRVGEGLGMLREEMRIQGFKASRRSYELMIRGFCEEREMETQR